MKKIILKFGKADTALAGFEYGLSVFNEQVKEKIEGEKEFEIIFPEEIELVASSFVQGFFAYLIDSVGLSEIRKNIVIKAKNDDLTNKIKKYIY